MFPADCTPGTVQKSLRWRWAGHQLGLSSTYLPSHACTCTSDDTKRKDVVAHVHIHVPHSARERELRESLLPPAGAIGASLGPVNVQKTIQRMCWAMTGLRTAMTSTKKRRLHVCDEPTAQSFSPSCGCIPASVQAYHCFCISLQCVRCHCAPTTCSRSIVGVEGRCLATSWQQLHGDSLWRSTQLDRSSVLAALSHGVARAVCLAAAVQS